MTLPLKSPAAFKAARPLARKHAQTLSTRDTLPFTDRMAYPVAMERDHVIARLKAAEPEIRALGASALYLFGSTARDEARPGSDVDIFIDEDPSRHVGFVELTDLEFLIRDLLDNPIDLTTRDCLHPRLKPLIEQSAIRVL